MTLHYKVLNQRITPVHLVGKQHKNWNTTLIVVGGSGETKGLFFGNYCLNPPVRHAGRVGVWWKNVASHIVGDISLLSNRLIGWHVDQEVQGFSILNQKFFCLPVDPFSMTKILHFVLFFFRLLGLVVFWSVVR